MPNSSFYPPLRICALFAIASLALMIISTLLATLGHCVRGHKMLLASGLYALGGEYFPFNLEVLLLAKVDSIYRKEDKKDQTLGLAAL